MVEQVKLALADLRQRGMRALVLDLRGNPGGVGPMSMPVARLIMSEPGTLGVLQMRGFEQNFKIDPEGDPFAGPVALLVDEGTASTSEIFAQGLQDLGRVTVVGGGPSAGAALPSLIEELPGGAVLQYVVGDYHSPKGIVVEGKGVQPDLLVDENRQDFVGGGAPVLRAAVEHLTKSLDPSPPSEETKTP
jgi:carboxyl-terminal processing protease